MGRSTRAVRLLFAGDVMLGRGVAPVAATDPDNLFAGIRFEVSSADLAVANLESPLTTRPHVAAKGPDALEATPSSAAAARGWPASTRSRSPTTTPATPGPETVSDTCERSRRRRSPWSAPAPRASRRSRRESSRSAACAWRSSPSTRRGRGRSRRRAQPGVAWWDEALARAAVEKRSLSSRRRRRRPCTAALRTRPRPTLTSCAWVGCSRRWGADVVWAAGPHVVQPVRLVDSERSGRPDGRCNQPWQPALRPAHPGHATRSAARGARRLRRSARLPGRYVPSPAAPVSFLRLEDAPLGCGGTRRRLVDARPPGRARAGRAVRSGLEAFKGKVIDAAIGDAEGNGGRQLVVSFRRPFRATNVNVLIPRRQLLDSASTSPPTSASTDRATCARSGWRAPCFDPSPAWPCATARSPSPTRLSTTASVTGTRRLGMGRLRLRSPGRPARIRQARAAPTSTATAGSIRSSSKGAHDDQVQHAHCLRSAAVLVIAAVAAGCGSKAKEAATDGACHDNERQADRIAAGRIHASDARP